ncbi:MAG: RNA 3'-terminal phosphate cyclase [Candidatus Micrarchaeota archaeon]
MIEIDGSLHGGGGQVLRTALSLSVALQKPFRITNIRASRPNPGLAAQHITAVRACAAISRAKMEGDSLGSRELVFSPNGIVAGDYSFDVSAVNPSAGSAVLVLQSILPPLLYAPGRSRVSIIGGTHVPWSPCYDYAEKVFLPAIARIGAAASASLQRRGFYPSGAGKITAQIEPLDTGRALSPFVLESRGILKSVSGESVASSLPLSIAERQKSAALSALAPLQCGKKISCQRGESASPGTFAFLAADYGNTCEGFFSLGAKGKSAEAVGKEAAGALLKFDSSAASVDEHLADQLLAYCALAQGESKFTVPEVTAHFTANAETVKLFLPGVKISSDGIHVSVIGAGLCR